MSKLVLLDEARRELIDAIVHYENIEQELGRRLRHEIDSSLSWIQDQPQTLRLRAPGYYRFNLRIFPYYIAYITRNDVIWVLAVAHTHRRPLYWVKRKLA